MRINHNIAALNTYRQLETNNSNSAKSLEKLSSGLRINKAGDDAAGLAISEKMRAQIRGLDMASKNSQDAISLIQTGEGALSETQSILQRMRELAVQSSNDTNVSIDRGQIQKEMNQLTSEVNRIGNTTEFNTMKLLDGSVSDTHKTGVVSSHLTLDAKNYTINNAINVTSGSTASIKNAVDGGAITVAAGDFKSAVSAGTPASSGNTYIKIIRTSATSFTVTLKNSSSGVTFSAVDTLTADANGNYSYNDHGVSFTIKASVQATVSVGAKLTVTVSGGTTSVAVKQDWSKNTLNARFSGGITISAGASVENYSQISFKIQSGTMTVKLQNSSGATNYYTDKITNGTKSFSSGYTYNAHGVSFKVFANSGGTTASGAFTLTRAQVNNQLTNDQSLKFQVGANQNQSLSLGISDMRAKALKITTTASGTANFRSTKEVSNGTDSTSTEFALSVSSSGTAANAITVLNDAINSVSTERSKLGAVQNRLEHTINNLDTASENLTASESRIRDVDMAKEMMEYQKNNILSQAAQSMMAQANQQPQGVLQLLR